MRNPFRRLSRASDGRRSEGSVADSPVRAPELVMAPPQPRREARTQRARRFRLAVVALFVVGLASLGAALWLSTSGHTSSTSDWSTWSPQDDGLTGAQEIADFVAPFYRASPSTQLAVVTALNLSDPSNPLQIVVPTSSSGSGSSSASGSALAPLPSSSTLVYNMCGEGSSDCSIGVGTPSSARLLLLRREALELALYSFKYLSGIDTVVALLPPGRTVQGCTGICPKPQSTTTTKAVNLAVAFDKQELKPWLDQPLRGILPEDLPPTVTEMPTAPEAELVSVITSHGLFEERTQQAQTGSSLIVLSPMPPQ